MDQSEFDALMDKLSVAVWQGKNLTSTTKIFSATINDNLITLYEFENIIDTEDNRPNLYINGRSPEFTEAQWEELNAFGEELLVSFQSQIQAAVALEEQQLENDIQDIIT